MEGKTDLTFGSFRLDRKNERLYRGRRELSLTPKAMQVLRYLIEHESQLVKKDELLEAVWQETIVEESSLKYHIGQIRAALGDNSRKPHFIRTVHRLGYSFIAQVQQDVYTVAKGGLLPALFAPKPASPVVANFVGRQVELSQLQECYAKARGGERQIVLEIYAGVSPVEASNDAGAERRRIGPLGWLPDVDSNHEPSG